MEAKASLFPFLSSLPSLFLFLPRPYNGRLCIDEGIRIRGGGGALCEFQNRKTSEI